MSIRKEKILFTGANNYLTINLGTTDGLTGEQQEIDKQIQFTTNESINAADDGEIRRMITRNTQTFKFYFRGSGGVYDDTLSAAGFTTDEISLYDLNLRNSFYIFDFFDTRNPNNQTRLFRTYLTKVKRNAAGDTTYSTSNTPQIEYIYVPLWYINQQESTTVTVYLRLMFYDAKTGDVIVFLNQDQEGNDGYNKYFFNTSLRFSDMTWYVSSSVDAKEVEGNSYTDRIQETAGEFQNQEQYYPSGAFLPETGTYEGGGAPRGSRTSATRTSSGSRTTGGRTTSTSTRRT
jgi:hypothetical protein